MKKETIVIIGSLLAGALIVVFLVMPEFDLLTVMNQELTDTKTRLDQLKIYNENVKELSKKYNLTPDEIEKFLSILPKEKELPGLLIQLETLASASGLIMNSVNFKEIDSTNTEIPRSSLDGEDVFPVGSKTIAQPEVFIQKSAANTYKIIGVDLALSGGYSAFKNYLHSLEDIESNQRLMDVVSLSLVGALDQSQSTILSFSISLQVYYQ